MSFSLVILFSNDRRAQLERSVELWGDLPEYTDCEKILCVDGLLKGQPPTGFQVCEIERDGPYFCWAKSLYAGISAASNPVVFYVDADRIVQRSFLQRSLAVLRTFDGFVFPDQLYSVKCDWNVKRLRELRDRPVDGYLELYADHRVLDPTILGRKNPFSGCVGFWKKTFLQYGGFDRRFIGWGYPDYDFFMQVYRDDREKLFPLPDSVELHQKHDYLVSKRELELHNLWNCRVYVEKWKIKTDYLENCRKSLRVSDALYTAESLDEFLAATIPQPLVTTG